MNNLITPDELIVSFKRNGLERYTSMSPHNLLFSVFGCVPAEWVQFQNIQEVASKFKMVEFLSGSLTLYFFNTLYKRGGTDFPYPMPSTIFICYQTARRWQPQTGVSGTKQSPQQEILFDNITDKQDAWSYTSELPGVSGKFVTNAGGGKPVQKLKWKFTQKSWNTLKADRTGFQCNLDEEGNLLPSGEPFYPVNNAVVKVAFDLTDNLNILGDLEMYASQRLLLRFKGRKE